MAEGWIKIHRQLKDHWLWKSERRLKWWIDILLTVNHSDSKVLIKGNLIECKRGQSIRSLDTWAKDWNVSKGAVRDFFRLLQSDGMLLTESLQFTTRITICKYEDYQTEINGKETQKKRTKNGKETFSIPKQECKECKEGEQIIKGWREDFNVYLSECKSAYKTFMEDENLMKEQTKLNPGLNLRLTLEKGYINFWGAKYGWENKKSSKSVNIDWKKTITNSIDVKMKRVYLTRQELAL